MSAHRSRLLLFAALGLPLAVVPTAPPNPPRARLVVVVFFDQFRGDYLDRWMSAFGDGGFRRLTDGGAWFENCHYPYAYTVTGAGHASVATGRTPAEHGVVGNDWFDRAAGKSVNCVGSDRSGVSAGRLLGPTAADALKAGTNRAGKVVALSLKDRGAALPGGHAPDAVYWLDGGSGRFVTSKSYRDAVHPWVAEYNREKPADHWRMAKWERLRPDLDYAALSGPDDAAGEGAGAAGQGRMFPHPFVPRDPKAKPAYYSALFASPFGNDLLLGLAERAIAAERLGADDVPDLLSISFSSNDAVGHTWGPDSQEVLDVTLRSDRLMKRLLDVLDASVGHGRYVLAMTADHGICPLPEADRTGERGAARVEPATSAKVGKFLTATYGDGAAKWLEAASGPWLYLNAKAIRAGGRSPDAVAAAVAGWAAAQEGVAATYTRAQLTAGVSADDDIGRMVARSFHPQRCGEVYVLLKPYHLPSGPLGTGTTHGSPYPYDTHVPLVVYGAGVVPGVRTERVTPLAAAAILARAAGVTPPAGATPVPVGLFADP